MVPQDAFLFHGTIAENIRLDRAGFDLEAIERAAQLAGADEFIAALPKHYETVVGERGLRLSGGQRQLVLLARALLTDPAILILDEPAQGLDAQAQERLGRALNQAARGRTVIMAMHRPDSVSWADSVVRLQNGRLEKVSPDQHQPH
jgi:ATP-binding cassette subfamily B protein